MSLAGCQTPAVAPKPLTFQSRADVVSDWERLAYRMIDRYPFGDMNWQSAKFAERFPPPGGGVDSAPGAVPFFVTYASADACGHVSSCSEAESDFAKAFKTLLEKALIDRGYTVVQNPAGAVIVQFYAQSFLYDSRHNSHLFESATVWTVLGGIGYQLRNIASVDTGFAAAAGLAPLVDTLRTLDDKTDAEVLVSITVADGVSIKDKRTVTDPVNAVANRRVLWRNTETLYVKPSNLRFYISSHIAALPVRAPESGR